MKKDNIEKSLERLISGDVDTPVEIPSSNRKLLIKIEELRQSMLAGREEVSRANVENRESIANVAHDLKTPLALIAGFAECIEDGIDDKDYPALIGEKTNQMNELVMSLINTAKQESGETAEVKERTYAPSFFQSEIEKHRLLIDKNGVKLKIGRIPEVSVYIDKLQIGNVMQNLISNAVKYSKGKCRISVAFKVRDGMLRVKVSDNGVGISDENLPRIFDKFFIEDKARKPGSTGLGLYIAKKQVENNGGKINVKSRINEGSVFTFTIPVLYKVKSEKNALEKFENNTLWKKMLTLLLFGWLLPWVFRLMKYSHTKRSSTLAGFIFSFIFFPVAWALDLISEVAYGRMAFLID